MSDCGCRVEFSQDPAQRRALVIALVLNASMAVIGGAAGWIASSTGLLADALDMASDASAYAIGLVAVGRAATFKRRAARLSGILLLILGLAVVIEVVRRFVAGSEPVGTIMVAAAALSLAINLTVLRLLRPFRHGEVHLRATWIFTRADVIANVGVIASAVLVIVTGLAWPDLVVGAAIGVYVVHEALEILKEARETESMEGAKL